MEKEIAGVKQFSYLTSEIDGLYHEAALKCGMSDSAMRILYAICLQGEACSLGDIIKLSGISKQTINSALRRLEGEGVLCLRPEKDGSRRKEAVLTKKGKQLAQNTVMKIFRIENEVFAEWNDKERELYFALTQRYYHSFKEKVGELIV